MAALKEKRTCGQRCEDFGHFVWNSDEGKFMGRTPEKWGKLCKMFTLLQLRLII